MDVKFLMSLFLPLALFLPARLAGDVPRPAAPPPTSIPDLNNIIKSGKLRVAYCDFDFPPLFYKDKDGKPDGVEVKFARRIAGELGVKAEFIPGCKSFNAVVDCVSRGDADIGVSFLTATSNRAKKVLFTQPYYKLKCTLLVNGLTDAKLDFNGNMELVKKSDKITLLILANSSYVDTAKKYFPAAKVEYTDDWKKIVEEIKSGKYYGTIFDEFHAKYVFAENPGHSLSLFYKSIPETENRICVAVNPRLSGLRDWLDIYLMERETELKAGYTGGLDGAGERELLNLDRAFSRATAKNKNDTAPPEEIRKRMKTPFFTIALTLACVAAQIILLFAVCPRRKVPGGLIKEKFKSL